MQFQSPLIPATLVRRYKRFLADMELEDGRFVTAHCANPGSMLGLAEGGTRCWLEANDDPKRKLRYGWRLVEHGNGHFTGVDTAQPNRILKEAFAQLEVSALSVYETARPEVRYGTGSRIDFLLSGPDLPDAYVEVKSVTLSRSSGLAEFPDSVTARGAKHLAELAEVAIAGQRAVMLFLVQRTDCARVSLAGDIDPAYARAFDAARAAGVETLCYASRITPKGIWLGQCLPFDQ